MILFAVGRYGRKYVAGCEMRLAGMMLPGKGWYVNGSRIAWGLLPDSRFEKLPPRCARLGTILLKSTPCSRPVLSQSAKKNVLFLMIGPPSVPPYWLRRSGSFFRLDPTGGT